MENNTVEYWLNKLPEPYKIQALENAKPFLKDQAQSIISAITTSFYWNETPQGHYYWEELCNSLYQ